MLRQILPRRPVILDGGRDDAATGEGLQEAGDVGIGGDLARGDDVVAVGDPHHPLVEGQVAELARRRTGLKKSNGTQKKRKLRIKADYVFRVDSNPPFPP